MDQKSGLFLEVPVFIQSKTGVLYVTIYKFLNNRHFLITVNTKIYLQFLTSLSIYSLLVCVLLVRLRV